MTSTPASLDSGVLADWALTHIDEIAIEGRFDNTAQEMREKLVKERFDYLKLSHDDGKFTLKPLHGRGDKEFNLFSGFATHTSLTMRELKRDWDIDQSNPSKTTMEITVPCDSLSLNLMIRFWMTFSFRVDDNVDPDKQVMEYAAKETDNPVYCYSAFHLDNLLEVTTPIAWAQDEDMAEALCAEFRNELRKYDVDDSNDYDLLWGVYNAYNPWYKNSTGKELGLRNRLMPILLSALLRNHDRIACGGCGDILRQMKQDNPTFAHDIDMGVIWWHQKQMAELRGSL